ncbi:MAG TPA: serine hydrolase domain-containing protein [Candidatus Limnocylindrales bacterium]|nr:serine hydrolase domain-containing protein [Candidatus Limnocylindrales bacterium]
MSEDARRHLERLVRQTQAHARVPGLQVAVHRADREPWTFHIGQSGTDRPLDGRTAFRIGSVTKTFVAVLVMQCRDDGLLALDDPLGAHLDVPALGDVTIRRLLSHSSGIQREPHGDVWAPDGSGPDAQKLIADLPMAEQVLPGGQRYHYSNLGFSLLGRLVCRLRGGSFLEILTDRVLKPLTLESVTDHPGPVAAVGYMVDAYSDHAEPEAERDLGATTSGNLWGTASDMAKWAAYLADPHTVDPAGAVLAPSTVDEMRLARAVTNESRWVVGFGLGLMLQPEDNWTVHVGHDGGMPGFIAGVHGRRGPGAPPAFGAASLGSSGTAGEIATLAHELLRKAVELDPPEIAVWRPGPPAPQRYRSALGRWWSEGQEFVFSWRDGRLQASTVGGPAGAPPAVFAETDQIDILRAVSGREVGERLRLRRDADGQVTQMSWATYPVTRNQQTISGRPF